MNLRIPGYSSDETRVSMSLSHSSATGINNGGADLLALAAGASGRGGKAAGQGGGAKTTKATKAEKNKDTKGGDTDARLGRGLRNTRQAAIRNTKR